MPRTLEHHTAQDLHPSEDGDWTLLQKRVDRALWQWDRKLPSNVYGVTRFVIVQDLKCLDFDDLEEAETLFRMMED